MLDKEREGPRGSKEYQKLLELIRSVRQHQRIDGVIKATQLELQKLKIVAASNEYRVDIYSGGFNPDSTGKIQAEPTTQSMKAFAMYHDDKYFLESRIKVNIIDDLALICPPDFPMGAGLGKVVGIFDRRNPGFLMLGYPIIHDRAL